MSFTKIVNVRGFVTTFSLGADDVALIQREAPRGLGPSSIDFDMLMTTAEREEALNALASPHFMSKNEFFTMLGMEAKAEKFTSESYDFMKYLISFGIPSAIAAQTAFLTDRTGTTRFSKRKKALEEFRESRHSIKLIQSGGLSGIITFLPYYLISGWGGEKLASRASRMVGDDPEALLKLLVGIMKFRGGKVKDSVSEVQFNVLMDFMKENYPATYRHDEEAELSGFVLQLILSDIDWSSASRFAVEDVRRSEDGLDAKLLKLLVTTTTTVGATDLEARRNLPQSVNTVVAVLKSKFGVEALTAAFGVLEANHSMLMPRSSYHFIAYVSIADYLAGGGSTEDSIGWMVAMEPALDQDKFFNRALINPA
jgi:hypothetical protein